MRLRSLVPQFSIRRLLFAVVALAAGLASVREASTPSRGKATAALWMQAAPPGRTRAGMRAHVRGVVSAKTLAATLSNLRFSAVRPKLLDSSDPQAALARALSVGTGRPDTGLLYVRAVADSEDEAHEIALAVYLTYQKIQGPKIMPRIGSALYGYEPEPPWLDRPWKVGVATSLAFGVFLAVLFLPSGRRHPRGRPPAPEAAETFAVAE